MMIKPQMRAYCSLVLQMMKINDFTPKKGEGCPDCNNTGYKGRQGIYEVLKKTPNLEAAILRDARGDEMLEVAIKDGFKTMQVIGRNFIKNGVLSIEEYSRIWYIVYKFLRNLLYNYGIISYTGVQAGKKITGEISAADPKAATLELRKKKIIVTSIKKGNGKSNGKQAPIS